MTLMTMHTFYISQDLLCLTQVSWCCSAVRRSAKNPLTHVSVFVNVLRLVILSAVVEQTTVRAIYVQDFLEMETSWFSS